MPTEIVSHKDGIIVLRVPMTFRKRGGRREIIMPEGMKPEDTASSLKIAVAKAFYWRKLLDSGKVESISELAKQLNMNLAHVTGLLRATFLAPDIIKSVIDSKEPAGLSTTRLRDGKFPFLWEEQRIQFIGQKNAS